MLHRATVHSATLGLLNDIMAKPALSGFYLAGGTSLALQIGHSCRQCSAFPSKQCLCT